MGPNGQKVVRVGKFFGEGFTNNEAKAIALHRGLNCLASFWAKNSRLCHLVRVWSDSQLIIRHLLGFYRKPSKARVYEAIERAKQLRNEQKSVSFRHCVRNLNRVADYMARRSLESQEDVMHWVGDVPPNSPANQADALYQVAEEEDSPFIDKKQYYGSNLDALVDALPLGGALKSREITLMEALQDARDSSAAPCIRGQAEPSLSAIMAVIDHELHGKPCWACSTLDNEGQMMTCDHCNQPWQRHCIEESLTQINEGPQLCLPCKGHTVMHGSDNVLENLGLIDYLFAGVILEDPKEAKRVLRLAEVHCAKGKEVQVQFATPILANIWVNLPPWPLRQQIAKDFHKKEGYSGREKLDGSLRDWY